MAGAGLRALKKCQGPFLGAGGGGTIVRWLMLCGRVLAEQMGGGRADAFSE